MPAAAPDGSESPTREILRPSQLNALARDLLEGGFARVWVEGEISNLSRPASGHLYFTLKDPTAQVRCALFRQRAQRIGFQPGNGQQVLARGRLTLYEPRGDYQLVLDHLEDAGAGALRAAFEALRLRLAAEGLFASDAKPPLPRLVRRLALLTSPRGAAVRDVLSVLGRRFPLLPVDVVPIPVQGTGAAAEIAAMLARAIRSGRYDAILLTRGGGSLEDLWAFNDEALVRTVAGSPVPIVCAIGHEVDYSLAEFAASLRAPTPSAAAELLVPDQAAVLAHLEAGQRRRAELLRRQLAGQQQRLDHGWARLVLVGPRARLHRGHERLAAGYERLRTAMRHRTGLRTARLHSLGRAVVLLHPHRRLREFQDRLHRLHSQLRDLVHQRMHEGRQVITSLLRTMQAVGPLATLERGYAILQDPHDGRILRRVADLRTAQVVRARLADGELFLRVDIPEPDR